MAECVRPGDSPWNAEWLGSFCAEFGKFFATRYGADRDWTWRLDHTLTPMVVLQSESGGMLIGHALPDRYYLLSPTVAAATVWDEVLQRVVSAERPPAG